MCVVVSRFASEGKIVILADCRGTREAHFNTGSRPDRRVPEYPLRTLVNTFHGKYPTGVSMHRPSAEKLTVNDKFMRYTVRGVELGRTPLQFVAAQKSGALVSSTPQEIQVFPPLRLEPRNITLIIGATLQVRV